MSISALEASVRGVRSAVLTAGPPDGAEAIVCVHGNPGPAGDWRALLTRAGELGRQSRRTCPSTAMPASRKTSTTRWTATPTPGGPARSARHRPRAYRRARLRRPVGTGLGRAPSRRPGQRHAHQHRRADRLPVAPLRPHLENAWSGRGLPGNNQPPGVPAAARAREPATDPRSNRSHLRRVPFLGHQARRAEALPRDPRAKLAGPPPHCDRSTVRRWSCGGPRTHTCPANRPSTSVRPFRRPTSNSSNGHGHRVMLEDPGRVASLVIPFLTRQLPGPATTTRTPASLPSTS